ncbi:uncharacterized protein LOC118595555 [Onychomys torridus]|uniref:uncharacterized protein LOC118595555 n=1 Tax=Onychomys torridus TaxID=38674 RepID=UPI00167FDBA0|nr:uncharacterized protein LOC118595555 [Onychomys torridus]
MKARLADEVSNTVLLNQKQVLQQVTSSCPACAQVNPGKTHLNRRSCLRGHRPGVHWKLDFTEVKPGLYGYRYLLVFIDTFLGWTEKETATMVTQKLLDDIFPSPTLEAHLQALQLVQKTVWKPLADAYWEQLNRPVMSHPFKIENSVWVHVSHMKAIKEPDKAENTKTSTWKVQRSPNPLKIRLIPIGSPNSPNSPPNIRRGIIRVLLILFLGPCIFNRLIQFVKNRISVVQALVLIQQYQRLREPEMEPTPYSPS